MDFTPITEFLYIGTTPRSEDYALLRRMGVGLVINMRFEQKPQPDPFVQPLPVLWLPAFDTPLVPIPVKLLSKGVRAALVTIQRGEKVYTYCAKGVHRGAAMGAAILIAQGHSAEEAMRLIKQRRNVADPQTWYIRWPIQRFADHWKRQRVMQ